MQISFNMTGYRDPTLSLSVLPYLLLSYNKNRYQNPALSFSLSLFLVFSLHFLTFSNLNLVCLFWDWRGRRIKSWKKKRTCKVHFDVPLAKQPKFARILNLIGLKTMKYLTKENHLSALLRFILECFHLGIDYFKTMKGSKTNKRENKRSQEE